MRKRGFEETARDNKHVRGKGGGGLAKGEDAIDGILSASDKPFVLILD